MNLMTDRVVIEPRRGKNEPALPETALIVFTRPDVDLILRRLGKGVRKTHTLYLSDVHVSTFERPVAVAGPLIGAPQSVMVLERLIALGVSRVVALGWCGSIQPAVRIGDVVMPTGALSEEGTSAHYAIDTASPGPAPEIFTALAERFAAPGLTVHTGPVWSTDAPFRETAAKVTEYQNRGILAVEMEISALFTVALYRGIQIASAMVVSDELGTLQWKHGFRDPRFWASRESMLAAALDAVLSDSFPSGPGYTISS